MQGKKRKYIGKNLFTQADLKVLNIKRFFIKSYIKSFKTSVTFFFNFTPDNCVRFQAVLVRHNLFFAGHCPMSDVIFRPIRFKIWYRLILYIVRMPYLSMIRRVC